MYSDINPTRRYCRKEAAILIGKSTDTLDRYTKEGKITAHTSSVNGRRYWKGADLIRMMTK